MVHGVHLGWKKSVAEQVAWLSGAGIGLSDYGVFLSGNGGASVGLGNRFVGAYAAPQLYFSLPFRTAAVDVPDYGFHGEHPSATAGVTMTAGLALGVPGTAELRGDLTAGGVQSGTDRFWVFGVSFVISAVFPGP